MLYVALTRSKRGLYVLLEPPSASQEADKPSLENWLARSVSDGGETGVIYQSGTPDWVENVPLIARVKEATVMPALARAVARRERTTPSTAKKKSGDGPNHSASGMRFGNEVHAAFECVGWVDEERPDLPAGDGGRLVAGLLEIPDFRKLFERNGRAVEFLREQPVDALFDGKWLSGVMDRLHLHRDESGAVNRVEIIDFKTDAVDGVHVLAQRYTDQMNAYQEVMRRAYPAAEVECILVSTRCREWISWASGCQNPD